MDGVGKRLEHLLVLDGLFDNGNVLGLSRLALLIVFGLGAVDVVLALFIHQVDLDKVLVFGDEFGQVFSSDWSYGKIVFLYLFGA